MTSGSSTTDTELSPALRDAARAAAQRAGMSVDEWLRATIDESAGANRAAPKSSGGLGGRLDQLSQRYGGASPASRTAAPASTTRTLPADTTARLADTVAKLNARLDQLTAGRHTTNEMDDRMSAVRGELETLRRNQSPSIAPGEDERSIDDVIAEISARQRALDTSETRAPAGATREDFVELRAQLRQMSEQIDSLRPPSTVDEAIAGLRRDLGDITTTINEALPRHVLEALQGEVRALGERLDRGYGQGADPSALASIESALGEVVQAINHMTPAEGLGAFEQQVRDLSHKLDGFSGGATPDPEAMHAFQAAVQDMRGFAQHVASAEALADLRADVHSLADRIERIAVATGTGHLESLADRVDGLTRALDTRGLNAGEMPQNIGALVQALTDKLDRPMPSATDPLAFDQIERQISRLADRIEIADQRFGNIGTIERGIAQLMEQVEAARAEAAAAAERVARSVTVEAQSGADVTTLRRDLASLQATQSETDRRTQDTLEAVHDTLERLVERLAMVETDIRTETPAPVAERPREPVAAAPVMAPVTKPAAPAAQPAARRERPPIDPDLPADTPLEPGVGARARTPAERIAASEAALSPIKREEGNEVSGKANFIAAARRAAQAAASEGAPADSARVEEHKTDETTPSSRVGRFLADKRRALMVGVAALLVIYGAVQVFHMVSGPAEAPAEPPRASSVQPAPSVEPPASVASPAAAPAMDAPTAAAVNRQSSAPVLFAPTTTTAMISPTPVQPVAPAPATQTTDVTGSIPQTAATAPATPADQPLALAPSGSDKLPVAIGGPALRAAAAAGNPAAEYEIGLRYAEGRGVTPSQDLAMRWFERAAEKGIAPALYRLGSIYEKGQGVKKDLAKARELYIKAGEKGNAKATHNLAVLYAEGIDGKPDYRTAADWFRKAASRGVADSQYNLGILYARGIGVEQNLAESYKWFSLAANQGDQDAAKKRDDVGARLDQQSLVAAKLAAQTFAVDAPPEDAMTVKAPPGGWDRATASPAKPAETKRKGT